jgi:SAM-dependent methyltransferase
MPVAARDSSRVARVGPVHFQPLAAELAQVERYFRGRVLNAGCGNRDITGIAAVSQASEVVNYDMHSTLPGAVHGSLDKTPFDHAEFDTILVNAVLEHVPDIDAVMRELTRVLKPGGHLIAAVPYLQPYHPDPTDFRRYTREGLEELGARHELRTVEILPVHTIWQTLGWIAWRWALEKRGLRPFLVYPIVWLTTRLFNRTDMRLRDNANTFQAVYTR